jgi:DnaJ family protein B protein 12
MARLKAKIQAQQAKQEAVRAAQAQAAAQAAAAAELEARRARLNGAFGAAFANAAKVQAEKKQAAAAAAAAAPSGGAADAAEVARVLGSRSHYDVLQLSPGCGSAALKKRYREMAMRLHPDKCGAEGASAAFQRANTAYQELLKVVL